MNTETNLVEPSGRKLMRSRGFLFIFENKITFRISMMMPKTFGWTKAVVRSVASS